jgi:hypothetical protein
VKLDGPEGLVAEVTAYRPNATLAALELAEKLRRRPSRSLLSALGELERPRVLTVALAEPEKDAELEGPEHPFTADVVDDATGAHFSLTGTLDAPRDAAVAQVASVPPPTRVEIDAAIAALRRDEKLGTAIKRGDLVPAPAMPGALVDDGRRAITIGLHGDAADGAGYRIANVDPVARTLLGTHHAVARASCGAVDDGGSGDGSTGGMVRVRVRHGEKTLWELVVVRAAAQEANGGVGLAVREVFFRGRRVLHRGDTPIVNVKYDASNHSGAASYRDWVNEEAPFRATGRNVIPGYRLCKKPPRTLFNEGVRAGGGFTGVTFHWAGTTLVATTLLAAGWYRYRVEWRFAADGTITPTFGFSAVKNPNTCDPHAHHAYWRFDFDVEARGRNAVRRRVGTLGSHVAIGDPRTLASRIRGLDLRWDAVHAERRMVRGPLSAWRVVNLDTKRGYDVYPSLRDGHADGGFGVGDVWALRYRPGQDRDANPDLGDRAHLDAYVNGESLDGTDVVLWYAAHARHDQHADDIHDVHGHVVGPHLVPVRWGT